MWPCDWSISTFSVLMLSLPPCGMADILFGRSLATLEDTRRGAADHFCRLVSVDFNEPRVDKGDRAIAIRHENDFARGFDGGTQVVQIDDRPIWLRQKRPSIDAAVDLTVYCGLVSPHPSRLIGGSRPRVKTVGAFGASLDHGPSLEAVS